jgi:cysteine desulfurase
MQPDLIYLDYNASTPVLPEVLERMLPWISANFANPASHSHQPGRLAAEAIEIAREQVAQLIGAEPQEVLLTSGATESLNLAIQGLFEVYRHKRNKILALATEHKAVLDVLENLQNKGLETELIPVDSEGRVDPETIKERLSEHVLAVCVMAANNETGRIYPVSEIARIAHEAGAFVICDATQAVGKIHFNVHEAGADIVAVSSHKFYGPKGIGALYVRRKNPRVTIKPILFGGGHERGFRPGTPACPLIVGMGEAARLARAHLEIYSKKMLANRELLETTLLKQAGIHLNAGGNDRLPNTSNVRIEGIKASELFVRLPELACSSGSACSSALSKPSHVLLAMGLSNEEAYASIRISTGITTRAEEIERAIRLILGNSGRSR